eukprot:s2791_g2.t1
MSKVVSIHSKLDRVRTCRARIAVLHRCDHTMSISQKLKQFRQVQDGQCSEERIKAIYQMALVDLESEVISFGKAKMGVPFKTAFEDNRWTDWFVTTYETSTKESHVKYVAYVSKTGCGNQSRSDRTQGNQECGQTSVSKDHQDRASQDASLPEGRDRWRREPERVHPHHGDDIPCGGTDADHARGKSEPQRPHDQHRDGDPRADPACEEPQPRQLREARMPDHDHTVLQVTHADDDLDYVFQIPIDASAETFRSRVQKLVKQYRLDLKSIQDRFSKHRMSSARLDLCEVMCSNQSELTRQAIALGGRAKRFTKSDADLSTAAGRQKLFACLIMERPRHLWYSPECKPWCLWNQFNAMRSLEQNEAIFQSRVQSLWQISLGIVLHEFQVQHGNHFHHEQPKGSNMLKVPGAQGIVEKTYPCCFDMCNVGQLRDPESGKAIRKRLEVRSTSQDLHTSLHRRWCDGTHEHQHIAGSTHVQGQPILRSEFTERYPAKFARQVVKVLLHEKSKTAPIFVEEAQEHDHAHPTKRRRLGSKMSTAAIDARFSNPQSTPVPSVSWLTVMQMADRMAARVGTKVVESGPLIEQVQVMCPDHEVKHVVLCRGTETYGSQ